jgi:hypothetical protein
MRDSFPSFPTCLTAICFSRWIRCRRLDTSVLQILFSVFLVHYGGAIGYTDLEFLLPTCGFYAGRDDEVAELVFLSASLFCLSNRLICSITLKRFTTWV